MIPAPRAASEITFGMSDATSLPIRLCRMKQGAKRFRMSLVSPESIEFSITFHLRKPTPSKTIMNTGMVAMRTARMWLIIISPCDTATFTVNNVMSKLI